MATPIFLNEKSLRSLSEFDFVHDPNDKNSKLGVGSFASVKLAKDKKTGKMQAIKVINMHPSKITSSDLHNIRTEITIHRKLEHPNIVKFHDYIQKDHNVFLILDYAETGNLYSYIHKKKTHLSPDEIFRYFHQTCLAIQYLHNNDILHRDIKPENLLLDKNLNIKLCDFGWSTRRIHEKRLTFCGTYEYMAPEIVYKKPYDYRVDIWSLGILLYELIHKEAPYKGRSLPEINKSLAKPTITFSSSIHPEAKDLISKILKHNPNDRCSMQQILNHPWVRNQLAKDSKFGPSPMETKLSPRNIRSASIQNGYMESPKFAGPRKDKENFKSEIFSSIKTNIFSEITSPQSKRMASPQMFASFNGVTSFRDNNNSSKEPKKDKERTKEASSLSNLENTTIAAVDTSAENSRRKPLQEQVTNTIQQQPKITAAEAIASVSRGHTKSSSSLSTAVLEKLISDDKGQKNSIKKKKIFENNILSPTFKTKVNTILTQLSSNTTTHKKSEEISSIFISKFLNQHNTSRSNYSSSFVNTTQTSRPLAQYEEQNFSSKQTLEVPLPSRTKSDLKNDENAQYSTSSGGSSNNSKPKPETDYLRRNHTPSGLKKNLHVKINFLKGDDGANFSSPMSKANRTARSKLDLRNPHDLSEMRKNPLSVSQKINNMDLSKTVINRNPDSNSNTISIGRCKSKETKELEASFSSFYRSLDYKKKQSLKFTEAGISTQLSGYATENRRLDSRDMKRDVIRDKENLMFSKEELVRNWA